MLAMARGIRQKTTTMANHIIITQKENKNWFNSTIAERMQTFAVGSSAA